MKATVKKYNNPTTTPAVSTTVSETFPSSITIDGEVYETAKNSSFHIDAETGNRKMGSYDFVNIGNGVWYCPETKKTLIGFEVHMSYEPMVPIIITEEFNWEEFFSLNVTPHGSFDGFVWRGDLKNGAGNEIDLMVNFLYEEDTRSARYDSMYRADLRIINSVEDFFAEFPRFRNWLQLSSIRANNPWLD